MSCIILSFLCFVHIVNCQVYVSLQAPTTVVYQQDKIQFTCIPVNVAGTDSISEIILQKNSTIYNWQDVVKVYTDISTGQFLQKVTWTDTNMQGRANVITSVTTPTNSAGLKIEIRADHVACNDEGNYRCTIGGNRAIGGKLDSRSTQEHVGLVVQANSIDSIRVYPQMSDNTYNPGTMVTLTCTGDVGNPAGDLRWCIRREGIDITFTGYPNSVDIIQGSAWLSGCQYRRSSTLTYNVSSTIPVVDFRCETGPMATCGLSSTIAANFTLMTCMLVESADLEYMNTSIRNYFSDTRHHDPLFSAYKERAKKYIYNEFLRFGLTTEYHIFQEPRVSPAIFTNVVGVLKGTRFGTAEDSIIGLGAHYDTVNITKGVDDNGAGVAAMLEVIRQISDMNKKTVRKNTIIFVSFDLEEYGELAGSRHFVQSWLTTFLSKNYKTIPAGGQGVIILDTMMEFNASVNSQTIPSSALQLFKTLFPTAFSSIASDNFRGDFLNLIYRNSTTDSKLASAFASSWTDAGREKFQLESFPLPFTDLNKLTNNDFYIYQDFFRSDHKNFWLSNLPAIWLTDSANLRGDMIQCYHSLCDNLEVMLTAENINFLGKTADALTMTIQTLSEPISVAGITDETPSVNYMTGSIRNYLSDTRHHDPKYILYKNRAKEYIYSEFVRFGLTTEYHTFQDTAVSPTALFQNVVGVLKGARFGTSKDLIIGLGAHYDTVNTTKGVDDNGAGVAAMLDVVRQITNLNKKGTMRENTIIFASFDSEENGPWSGSKHFLELWLPKWLSTNYGSSTPARGHGVIIMDTMMEFNTSSFSQVIPVEDALFQKVFPTAFNHIKSDNMRGDFLALIYRQPTEDSKLAGAFESSWKNAGRDKYQLESLPLPFTDIRALPPDQFEIFFNFLRSDHTNFWLNNYPAIWLTDSANFRGDMVNCYHNPCDNLEVMLTEENINFLGKTADSIAITIHKLSEPTDSSYDITSSGFSGEGVAGIILGILIPMVVFGALVLCYRRNAAA